jgi:aspartate carbamoyltransferase catalytic subunit
VARSDVWLLHHLGAEVTLVSPPTLVPVGVETWPCSVTTDLDEALASGPDAVMMLRVQAERMHGSFFPSVAEYSRRWGLSAQRVALLPDNTTIMHPGPMNRGLEISSVAADSPRSRVLDQVSNGVAVRMAVLYLVLAAPTHEGDGLA